MTFTSASCPILYQRLEFTASPLVRRVRFRPEDQPPPVMAAVIQGVSVDGLQAVRAQHDPQATDAEGRNALMAAAWLGREDLVQDLMTVSDVRHLDHQGMDALMLAAAQGHLACVDALLPGADTTARSPRLGASALVHAVRRGHAVVAERLVRSGRFAWTDRDPDGRSLLFHALLGGPALLQALAGRCAVNEPDGEGFSVLMYAAQAPAATAATLISTLLDLGANPAQQDPDGRTALMHTAGGTPAAVRALLPVSNPMAVDHQGRTALMMVAGDRGRNNLAVLDALLADPAQAALNARDVDGASALMLAVHHQHEALALRLIEAGADVHGRWPDGSTVLMGAVEHGHVLASVVTALTHAGSDVLALDAQGHTALHRVDTRALDEIDAEGADATQALMAGLLQPLPPSTAMVVLQDPASGLTPAWQGMTAVVLHDEQRQLAQAVQEATGPAASPVGSRPRARL